MIQGSQGSLTLYYKDLLIGYYPLTKKKTYEIYKYQGDILILKSMRETKFKIKQQIETYIHFCNVIYNRKKNKLGIRRGDYEMFLSCIFALIKLQIIDEEQSIFIMPKYKRNIKRS